MKIYKGPRTTNRWTNTDTLPLTEWSKDWTPGKQLMLDGTIEKSGTRHTKVGIEFEAEDIAALHDASQRFQKQKIQMLEAQVTGYSAKVMELHETISLLETAFQKLDNLASLPCDDVDSADALLGAVQQVAEHFRYAWNRKQPLVLEGIDWEAL